MRRAAQVLLLAAAGALVAPAVAEAYCWTGYCESYGYDVGGYVYGYSRTYGYYGDFFLVETSLTDPQWSTVSNWAEGQFEVTAEVWGEAGSSGDYYIEGNHYYWGWDPWLGWHWDGASSYDVYVFAPPPPPQITVCPLPSPAWGSGSQFAVIGGSGFWGYTPQVSWSGNGGVNFLESSTATVTSDSQIDLSVSLAPVTSEGSITLGVGTAACMFAVQPSTPPSVSGPNTVWWFNGQTPSGYSTSITLTSSGGAATIWNVTQGQNKVSLSGSGAQVTVTSSGTVFSSSVGDIRITATANGLTSAPFEITSRKPAGLYWEETQPQCDPDYGYETKIYYTIQDQLNANLPSAVPVNEAWTTEIIPDYTGTNWRRGPVTGGMTESSTLFYDRIQGELVGYVPAAACDGNSTTKVQHWGQQWFVGSTTSGSGVPVQTNTLQKYLGRADHLLP